MPLEKYTKTQCKLDVTVVKNVLEAHFNSLSFKINKRKAYGVKKLTAVNYLSIMLQQ